jgi:hypothetical protein
MKTQLICTFTLVFCLGNVGAQVEHPIYQELSFAPQSSQVFTKPTSGINNAKSIIWNETFDIGSTGTSSTLGPTFTTSNGTWTTGGVDGNVWKHSFYTTSGEWSAGVPPFTSTTATNGFMLFDSDSVNFPISPNYVSLSGELISPPIDLTGQTSAILTLEQAFRFCCAPINQTTVSISSDNGATWGAPYNYADSPEGIACGSTGDVFESTINITGEAAGNTILLKFNWDGNASGSSHYFWDIDDISISTLPDDDVRIIASWFTGENHGGQHYGIHDPMNADNNYKAGATVYNAGALSQTNVLVSIDLGFYSEDFVIPFIAPDSLVSVESTLPISLPSPNNYSGTYTVFSGSDTVGGIYFSDNQAIHEFQVSDWQWTEYAVDGIGVYSNPIQTPFGTNSVLGGDDGMVLATKYHFTQSPNVYAMKILLDTATIPGGEIFGSFIDSTEFWSNGINPLCSIGSTQITAVDVAQGYIYLNSSGCILSPGAYYAAIQLFSNAGANPIVIQDDLTIEQPLRTSAINIPNDQSYTNGNAYGIRLILNPEGIDEHQLQGVSIYPNPSDAVITITDDNYTSNSISVNDISGKLILTKEVSTETTIDLSISGSGVYLVTVSNENGSMVERIVIH